MVIFLTVLLGVSLIGNGVLLVCFLALRRRLEEQKIILTTINASEDIEYILSTILSLMEKILRIPVISSVVVMAEESNLKVLFSSSEKNRIYHFFSSLNRSEMYQFLMQCFSLTRNIFATDVLALSHHVSLDTASLLQRFQHLSKSFFPYLIIPIYDKEIAGLIVFEVDERHPFSYKNVARLQKSIAVLNVAFSRVLLLWNLRQQSITDPLTGLLNKRQFVLMAEKLFSLSKRKGKPFALAIFDIDNFKHINDTYGHHIGDIILKDIAERIVKESRQADYLFRIGGDEFCILFSDIPSVEEMKGYSERIHAAVKAYNVHKPTVMGENVTLSMGWAIESNAIGWVDVFEKADKHMYEQKRKYHVSR